MTIPVDIKKLREQELFIATPMYGAQCTGPYVESIMEYAILARKYDLHYILRFHYNESLIQRARNYLVDEFLNTTATHMMFIDADIKFDAIDILTLQALAHKTDKHVICGIYPKKQLQWAKVKKAAEMNLIEHPDELAFFATSFAFNLVPGTQDFEINKPIEIMEGATGFMMIQRRVFEDFAKKYPETLYTTDDSLGNDRKINAFFDCKIDPQTNRYLSEDYCFSHMVRAIGLKVWMCPWMQLGHQGNFLFQGDLRAISAIQASLV
jgi:predicted metal-binding protein